MIDKMIVKTTAIEIIKYINFTLSPPYFNFIIKKSKNIDKIFIFCDIAKDL